MNRKFFIWAIGLVSIIIAIGTLGIWGFNDSTTIYLAYALCGTFLIITVLYILKTKQQYKSSFNALRDEITVPNFVPLDSYNAYCHNGELFRSISLGNAATLDYDSNVIIIKTQPEDTNDHSLLQYNKAETEVLWVGNSGRPKDYYTWLEIKDLTKASLVSIFKSAPMQLGYDKESKQCAAELYYRLSDIGYRTGIDNKKRGWLLDVVGIVGSLIVGTLFILNHEWFPGVILIGTFFMCLYSVLSKNGPPSRKYVNG